MTNKVSARADMQKVQSRYHKLIRQEGMVIVLAGVMLALFYSLLTDSYETITPFINGIIIGVVCGMAVAWSELILFRNASRKMSFIGLVTLKVVTTVMLVTGSIFSVILISRSLTSGMNPLEIIASDAFRHFLWEEDFHIMILYAFGMACIIMFTKQMNHKLGQGVLFNFITGKYAHPFHEERIFLFIDLDGSTNLAERLGDLQYHRFLNEFFCDVAEPVVAARGAIHHYVGDEVVITWKMEQGLESGNCLNAYFAIVEKMEKLKPKYMALFNVHPSFKAAYHCGPIVTGEIGDIKSQIVFHGDVVNTTSRIERLCSRLNEKLLISKELMEKLPLYNDRFQLVGSFELRGKKSSTEVFGLRKVAPDQILENQSSDGKHKKSQSQQVP
ncbi:MAG: adenylate/guanylate cyclase domain-containing protein [Cyclobacteriaceae bacterium]